MKGYLTALLLFMACVSSNHLLGQEVLKLAPPVATLDAILFDQSAQLTLSFELEEAEIYYKVGKGFEKYEQPIVVKQTQNIPFFSKKKDFLNSDTITITAIKKGQKKIDSIRGTLPNEAYLGNGLQTLIDGEKGGTNFRDGKWLGFSDSIITLEFEMQDKITSLGGIGLDNPSSWIFLPQKMELYAISSKGKSYRLKETVWPIGNEVGSRNIYLNFLDKKKLSWKAKRKLCRATSLRLVLYPATIPTGHPGAGQKAWVFLDEIIAN